jgi:hypothetical protein
MLVPHVYGTIEKSINRRNPSTRKKWDEKSFFEDAVSKTEKTAFKNIGQIYNWAIANANSVGFGTGGGSGSFSFYIEKDKKRGSAFSVYSNGVFTINLDPLKKLFPPDKVKKFSANVSLIPSMKGIDFAKQAIFTTRLDTAFAKPEYLDAFQKELLLLLQE